MLFKNFTNENASEKITVKERLAYGCGDFSSNIMYSADTEEFLHNMFSAYNKGCKDLSGLLSGTESQGILLSETYTDDKEGFSFHYSSTWIPVSEEEYTSQFGNIGDGEL